VPHAAALAHRFHSRITVLHVLVPLHLTTTVLRRHSARDRLRAGPRFRRTSGLGGGAR
jgi:hypothetical protein